MLKKCGKDFFYENHYQMVSQNLEERLRFVLLVAKMGVWEWDVPNNHLSWDDNMFELYGIQKGEFSGRVQDWVNSLFAEDAVETQKKLQESLESGQMFSTQYRIMTPAGDVRNIGARGYVERDPHGEPNRMIGVNWDETTDYEQKRTIENQKIKMVEASRLSSLGEIAGGIAHEINNPLTIILGTSQHLRKLHSRNELAPEVLLEKLAKIESTADRIVRIVKSLKFFARDGSEDLYSHCPLGTIVHETLELCQEKIKNFSVNLSVASIPDVTIECRPVQISQVLLNLLTNAFDAVHDSEEKLIMIEFEVTEKLVRIFVKDSGLGIPNANSEKIFIPFFTTKDIGKGTGLGLSLSKGIIESHGGRLTFLANLKMTTFVIELPKVHHK